jgi:hypothetical protein
MRRPAMFHPSNVLGLDLSGPDRSSNIGHVLIRCMQPLAVFIALAPFIGMDEAGEFLLAKLSASDSDAPAAA